MSEISIVEIYKGHNEEKKREGQTPLSFAPSYVNNDVYSLGGSVWEHVNH